LANIATTSGPINVTEEVSWKTASVAETVPPCVPAPDQPAAMMEPGILKSRFLSGMLDAVSRSLH